MKRILLFMLVVILTTFMWQCKKDPVPNDPVTNMASLSFDVANANFDNLKSTGDTIPICIDSIMDYVEIELDGVTYYLDIIYQDDFKLITEELFVDLGVNTSEILLLTKFLVWHDALPLGPGPEDILVKAAPEPGSLYWDLMTNKLNIEVEINTLDKTKIIIDVLCFNPSYYTHFGFSWYQAFFYEIETQLWAGNLCLLDEEFEFWEGTLYENQMGGIETYMPLIMKVEVLQFTMQWDTVGVFSNEAWLGEGEPIEVYWLNSAQPGDSFKFDIYILNGFIWELYESHEFYDDNCPDPNVNGINYVYVDFCEGGEDPGCVLLGIDYPTYADMTIDSTFSPSPLGYYMDADLQWSKMMPGVYGTWCARKIQSISLGVTYPIQLLSTLEPLPTAFQTQISELTSDKIEYLYNHIQDVIPTFDYNDPTPYYEDIQQAIWWYTDGWVCNLPDCTTVQALIAMTDANYASWEYAVGDECIVYLWAGVAHQPLFMTTEVICLD